MVINIYMYMYKCMHVHKRNILSKDPQELLAFKGSEFSHVPLSKSISKKGNRIIMTY